MADLTTEVLSQDVFEVQNPALGAVLLWRFVCSYSEESGIAAPCPLLLLFLPLPLLFSQDTHEFIASTQQRSGLAAFAAKFESSSTLKTDRLLEIHGRADDFRLLTLQSIQLAYSKSLVSLDVAGAQIFALTRTLPSRTFTTPVAKLVASSHKLGAWFARLTILEISSYLKVRF